MTATIKDIKPEQIEAESFRIIASELGPTSFDEKTFQVVQRVIHATGDFSFAENMVFHPQAIKAGINAIKQGKNILTDVNMAAVGISKALLHRWGGKVICRLGDPDVADIAVNAGKTRTETAIERGLEENIGIVAIGNAPTALLKVMECIVRMKPSQRPDLVVGVPVGFVNAAESKELLAAKDYPFIACKGRKGGSPVAAAIVNALIRLAVEG